MKRTRLLVTLVAVAVIAVLTSDAFARNRMYNPATGTFMQRDPMGTPNESPLTRNVSSSRFTQHDPMEQYADGPNLYQYARSNPARYIDPAGLWGKEVHFGLTNDMMAVPCPKIAQVVAAADQGMDENFHDAPAIVIFGWLTLGLNTMRPEVQQDYSYHFPGAGPPLPGQQQQTVVQGFNNQVVSSLLREIVSDEKSSKYCKPEEFGKFLHMLQDSWSHGGAPPDAGGHPKGVQMVDIWGRPHTSGGILDVSVDNPLINYDAYVSMKADTIAAMLLFHQECPCACAGGKNDSVHPTTPSSDEAMMAVRMMTRDVPAVREQMPKIHPIPTNTGGR